MPKAELSVVNSLEINAKQKAALLMTGHRLYQQAKLKEAMNIFEGLALIDSSMAYVHGILGSIYQKEEKPELAIAQYDWALKLFPRDMNSLTNRGELYLKLGRFEKAASDLEQVMKLDPNKKHPAANRARLLVSIVHEALQLAKEQGIEAVEAERKKAKVKASQNK